MNYPFPATLLLLASLAGAPAAGAEVTIVSDYPGANILFERQEGNHVFLRQDLHDTKGWWFYWNFGVRTDKSGPITFHFTNGDVIGTRGPAFSTDGGESWSWLGVDSVQEADKLNTFTFDFPNAGSPVYFAFAPPYQASHLERFLSAVGTHPNLSVGALCQSENGRTVERLHLGRLNGDAKHRVLLTARHHACESMASYVVEGLMKSLLQDESGAWFRENVEVLVIPFVDKDGVEEGDQGKNRIPRDHGRDYQGESVYESTRAIRAFVPEWADGRLRLTIDIHCPHIRGENNEHIYQVGHEDEAIWREQQRFAALLAGQPDLPLPYEADKDLPFGTAWNKASNYTAGAGIFHWSGTIDSVQMATAIEIPYANAGEITITPERAREFGGTLLATIQAWLKTR